MSGGEINIENSEEEILKSTRELDDKRRMEHQISYIIEMVHQSPSDIPKSYIPRVHSQLRAVNEKAYDPVLVSIGPYHHKRRETDLQFMETHKSRYLGDLMKRREKKRGISEANQLCEYVNILGELEVEARSYYEQVVTLEKDAFIKMMLVDACFIIELFQRATWSHFKAERETDPLFKANWIEACLERDLILVENQIPFFVLLRLYPLIGDYSDPLALIFLAVSYLPIYRYSSRAMRQDEYAIARKSIVDLCDRPFVKLPPSTLQSIGLAPYKLKGFKHLLDLTHNFMLIEELIVVPEHPCLRLILPKLKEAITEPQGLMKATPQPQELKVATPQPQELKEATPADYEMCTDSATDYEIYTYSATELRDLGVTFRGVQKSKFYDIRFKNGVMKIPVINIDDGMETRLRNLVAYEEHSHCNSVTFIGNYMSFMDGLINTAEDVELLRHHGIIVSLMGDDEEIANIFNNMGKNVTLNKYFYKGIIEELKVHCRKRRHVWMAKLKQNYLNSPWAVISVIAAIVLLILTITQTVYTALAYHKP